MKTIPQNWVVLVLGILLFTGCGESNHRQIVDVKPVGDGLMFLGLAGVLMTLIVVFGKFLNEATMYRWVYLSHFMVALFSILALVIVAAAIPALLIPISVGVVLAVILAFAWYR